MNYSRKALTLRVSLSLIVPQFATARLAVVDGVQVGKPCEGFAQRKKRSIFKNMSIPSSALRRTNYHSRINRSFPGFISSFQPHYR